MMAEYSTDLLMFLRSRGISEDTINLFEEQKVDREAILLMEDAQLANYLPSFGDRVALFSFCKTKTSSLKRKPGVFEKLREKLKQRRMENTSTVDFPDSSNITGSKKKVVTRIIEIGWIHNENQVSKQVRAKQGGGTRKVTMNTRAEFDDILKQAKALFFPEGRSRKGDVSDFEFDVWDFKKNSFPKGVTIDNIYNSVKLAHLRFYLATQPKSMLTEDDISCMSNKSDPDLLPAPGGLTSAIKIHRNDPFEFVDVPQEDVTISEESNGESSETGQTVASSSHVASNFVNIVSDLIILNGKTNSDPEIRLGPQQTVGGDLPGDTRVYQPDEVPQRAFHILTGVNVALHHLNSFSELVEAFSDSDIMSKTVNVRRLLHDNSVERVSGSGVLQDVYSSFWSEFYERCTVGTIFKVPFLRHDFCEATWKAIGRILLKGFQDCQFFPAKLAPPFVEEILFGSAHSNLTTSFLQFVSSQEKDVLQQALDDFASVDVDDLLELMESFECRKRVKAANLPVILEEISHKELVQKPMFVIHCWREIIQPHMHLSSGELTNMYNDLCLKINP